MASWWDAVPAIASVVGKIASGSAKGSAEQRAKENQAAVQQNQLLAQLYNINQNATQNALTQQSSEKLAQGNQELARKEFALNAPTARARQSVRGSILANAQPVSFSGLPDRVSSRIPTMSGGLSPALFSADTRALGNELTRDAILDQLAGDTFTPMTATNFQSGILQTPKLEEYQKSDLLEKILAGIGVAGTVVGEAGSVNKTRQQQAEEDLYADNPFENAG